MATALFHDRTAHRQATRALWLVVLMAWGAVVAALVSQYQFGMLPCPWCILQRLIFIGVGAVAMVAALLNHRGTRSGLAALALALCVAGAAAAIYQKLVASKLQSCALTLADRILTTLSVESWWPWLLSVQASCADAAVDLLGLPYEMWALIGFVVLGGLLAWIMTRPRHA